MDFQIVAEGRAFPEGPIVMPDGSILFVEVMGGTLTRAWGEGRVEVVAHIGGGPNGAQIGPDGAIYICNNGGIDFANQCNLGGPEAPGRIERVDPETGKVERIYDGCAGRPLSAPNDLVFDSTGGIWFTDMGKTLPQHSEHGGLYYCRCDGSEIRAVIDHALSFNGVGLSADEKTVYIADTRSARIWRLPLDAAGTPGPSTGGRNAAEILHATVPGDLWLDSLAVTEAGNVCVATIWQGGIATVSPDGAVCGHVALPDSFVTNIAFGGDDMRTAYITLSATGRIVRTRWPEPGLKLNWQSTPGSTQP